jgi:hypothetical protein
MRTLAHALIQRRYVEKGMTTRFITLPIPDSGLPQTLVQAGQPVTLDILAGRPVNLELSDAGLSVDLCFSGPPQRCQLPWQAILATQDLSGDLVQTTVVTVATVMEDNSLVAAQPPEEMVRTQKKLEEVSAPPIAIVKGGKPSQAQVKPARSRPKLHLVSVPSGDDRSQEEDDRNDV